LENTSVVSTINKCLLESIEELTRYKKLNFILKYTYGSTVLNNFNTFRVLLDQQIERIGIQNIKTSVLDNLDIFCKCYDFNESDLIIDSISELSHLIQESVADVSAALCYVFGDSIPCFENTDCTTKMGALETSDKLMKLIQIDSFIIQRSTISFGSLFKHIKINQNYYEKYLEKFRSCYLIDIQIIKIQKNNYEKIKEAEQTFKHIQIIVNYAILFNFRDKNDILNNLFNHLDECTNILMKFSTIHSIYKFLLGNNYLSYLKIILKKIFESLRDLELIDENLDSFKKKYPYLIYSAFETYLNETFKNNMEFLPDQIKKSINKAIQNTLSKLGDKLMIFDDDAINSLASIKYKKVIRKKIKTEETNDEYKTKSEESLDTENKIPIKPNQIKAEPISFSSFIGKNKCAQQESNEISKIIINQES
jgi:hypothetical protein